MSSYSILSTIGQVLLKEEIKVKQQVADFLDVDLSEVNEIIKQALGIISSATAVGFEIGLKLSPDNAAIGAAVGFGIGVIVVIGMVVYKIYISKDKNVLVMA